MANGTIKRKSNSSFAPCLVATRMLLLACGLLALCGCANWLHQRGTSAVGPAPKMPSATPTAAELVGYWNDNARRLQSLECRDLQLDASMKLETIGLTGQMICQKPKNFRLSARVAGTSMADLGSNDQEFWFWIGKSEPPYLYHCSHQDFAQGRSRMQIPFQPEWVMLALGMAEYDPNKKYRVDTHGGSFELIEQSMSPQGRPLRKVTVFSRAQNQVQVAAHKLQELDGKEICTALITQVNHDPASGATYPRQVQLIWHADQMKLKMRLEEVTVNRPIEQDRVTRLFTRPFLRDVQSYNLASGPDAPGGVRQAGNYR